jgi:hypothetical protein
MSDRFDGVSRFRVRLGRLAGLDAQDVSTLHAGTVRVLHPPRASPAGSIRHPVGPLVVPCIQGALRKRASRRRAFLHTLDFRVNEHAVMVAAARARVALWFEGEQALRRAAPSFEQLCGVQSHGQGMPAPSACWRLLANGRQRAGASQQDRPTCSAAVMGL